LGPQILQRERIYRDPNHPPFDNEQPKSNAPVRVCVHACVHACVCVHQLRTIERHFQIRPPPGEWFVWELHH
jgi:hypothetical protein